MFKRAWNLISTTYREWRDDNASSLAAALAYYTTFSLAPLLIVVIAIAGLMGGQQAAQNQAMAQVEGLLGVQGRQFVQGMIESASRPSTGITATLLGTATLLFGALGAFSALQSSLNTIWEVKPLPAKNLRDAIRRFVMGRMLSFALVLGIGFLLLASLVISAGLAALGQFIGGFNLFSESRLQIVNFVVSLAVITVLFMMIFKFLPEVKIAWRDVWLGALVTSLLFNIGKSLIGLYLGQSRIGTTFGAAGSLAIILIWVYYSAQILFLGAEFTQVYAQQSRRAIEPKQGMVRVPGATASGSVRRETPEGRAGIQSPPST
ncbi:MAG: YihY/virulence factor BrkB family protein [Bacteroidota bacterium]